MTAEHTPGPWKFSTSPQPNGCPIVGSRGLMVAMLAHSVNYPDQEATAIANARLIAAAPDMLIALREAEAALEVAVGRLLKAQPDYPVHVTSEGLGLALVRSAIAQAAGSSS